MSTQIYYCIVNRHTGRSLRCEEGYTRLWYGPENALTFAADAVREIKSIAAYSMAVGVCESDPKDVDPDPGFHVLPLTEAETLYPNHGEPKET